MDGLEVSVVKERPRPFALTLWNLNTYSELDPQSFPHHWQGRSNDWCTVHQATGRECENCALPWFAKVVEDGITQAVINRVLIEPIQAMDHPKQIIMGIFSPMIRLESSYDRPCIRKGDGADALPDCVALEFPKNGPLPVPLVELG